MKHELIDRYIYAVTRHLPEKQRADVEQELAGLIADMLEARCGEISPQDKDVRVVLTELGAPQALASKYAGEEEKALISGEYFLLYKRVLKIVLPIAAAGIALAGTLSTILSPELGRGALETAILLIGQALASIVGGAVQAFAIITFVFAVLDHKKVKLGEGDFLDSLPEIPEKNARITPGECIAGMVMCVLMALVFLAFPQVMGGWTTGVGWVPAFETQAMRSMWLPIAVWAALGIGREAMRLAEGRHTKRGALVSLGIDIITAVCAAAVFVRPQLMNSEFISKIASEFGETPWLGAMIAQANIAFFGIVLFALVLDIATSFYKAWKYDRTPIKH